MTPVIYAGEIKIIPMTSGYMKNEYDLSSQESEAFFIREEARYQEGKKEGAVVCFKGKFVSGNFDI